MLYKIPKIDVESFTTVDAMASGAQGFRTPFSNTFLSLKLALRVVSENTDNVFSKG